MNPYWQDRGFPWEYDRGPAKNLSWARLFAETPNYRKLSQTLLDEESYRWHFGPMYFRGRLKSNSVKVLVIGQEGAQDESLTHRSFTGSSGSRMQHLLKYFGINYSYLFVNTFVYPILGQYTSKFKWMAQDPGSPIVKHRHKLFNYILKKNDVRLIIAVGNAAKETVTTWITSRGGTCPAGSDDVSQCTGEFLDPKTKIIGVVHPGGGKKKDQLDKIKLDFKRASNQVKQWIADDPNWLVVDKDTSRDFSVPFEYGRTPIPFRDFPFGTPWRLGRGATTSNRMDEQRSIQIFSADGKYNESDLVYGDMALGDTDGYTEEAGDVPYEPPVKHYRHYDKGPSKSYSKLFMGGRKGLAWPDFNQLGAQAHDSFGYGPIYRGRLKDPAVLVLADQQSYDDLFTFRALTGNSGQHLQAFLEAMGINYSYAIVRVLPIDILDLESATQKDIVDHPQVKKIYQVIVDKILKRNKTDLILTFGKLSDRLQKSLELSSTKVIGLKAWKDSGALANWKAKLQEIQQESYRKDIANPGFQYNGTRSQIPRYDLPYGILRWQGSSGDRARKPTLPNNGAFDHNYYKQYTPDWVYQSTPLPLSASEEKAIEGQV